MMDKNEARIKAIKHILKTRTCITAPDYIAALAIDEYEKLLTESDDEAWREENLKKQAAGVKFEMDMGHGLWVKNACTFTGRKEWYREAQEAPKPTIPHLAERALYWKQRAEGTNEVWQVLENDGVWNDLAFEPSWHPGCKYRPKPKTRTTYFCLVRLENGKVANLVAYEQDLLEMCKSMGVTMISTVGSCEVECGIEGIEVSE